MYTALNAENELRIKENTMKKLIILLFALLSAVCFTAFGCGGKDGGSSDNPPQQTETYSVTFYDEDGTEIKTSVYGKGETPACDYEKAETEFYSFTLSGWATESGGTASATLPAVTENASYYAVVRKTIKDHFLQFAEDLINAEDIRAFVLEKTDALYNSKKSAVPEEYVALADDIYAAVRFGAEILSAKTDADSVKQTLNACYNTFYKSYELYARVSANPSDIIAGATEYAQAALSSAISYAKQTAIDKLDDTLTLFTEKITDETIKSGIVDFKNREIAKLNGIEDIASAKAIAKTVADDALEYLNGIADQVIASVKSSVTEKLDQTLSALIEKLPNEALKTRLSTFKTTEIAKLDGITDLDSATSVSQTIADDTTTFIGELVSDAVDFIKDKAIEELDAAFSALIEKLPDDTLKARVSTFKTTEIAKLDGIEDIDSARTVATTIASDTVEFTKELVKDAVTAIKNKAIAELDSALSALIEKITDESLKVSVSTFKDQEIAKFNDVKDIDTAKATATTVASDAVAFAKDLLMSATAEVRAKLSGYLDSLKSDLNTLPSSYLPATMTAGYAQNFVTATSVNYDFTEFTAVSDINYGGFGEQWHMVAESVAKSDAYFKAVTVTSNALSVALAAVSDLLENGAEVNFEKTGENYTVSVNYENGKMQIYAAVTSGYTIPLIGTVAPVIELCYDEDTAERTVYIYLSENAAVRSVSTADSFEFGIRYGVSYGGFSGFKESYFSIAKTAVENTYEGHIYEFTTVQGKDMIKACADFYIDSEYVSVVGNKASGMIAYKGYINELYKTAQGRLIGYEVMEDLTIALVTSTYNTLWFNLTDISGINTVKVTEKSKDNKSSRSTVDVYLNGSDTLFSPTYNKKLGAKTSRKYDIELRTRYYYGLNEDGELTEYEKEVPMMFIQEDNKNDTNFTDYPANVLADNGITSSVTLNNGLLNKILDDYDNLIPIFKENCENITSAYVKQFIAGE